MSRKQTAIIEETTKGTVRPHQPGESAFNAILTEDIDWKPFPAFPPSVRLAVVVGQPSEPGPYVIRVRVPRGVKLMPHKHPEDRIYTVMSGVFYIGLGDEFDANKLEAYPPGTVIILPGNTWHFIGRNPASTSRRYQRSVRLAWNMSARKTIRGIRVPYRHPKS